MSTNPRQFSSAARDVLANANVEGNILYLPPTQLARPLYVEVNEVLSHLGGKWKGGKVKGHVFESDPSSDLEVVIQTGLMPPKNPTSVFPTPTALADQLTSYIPHNAYLILEPSAGTGSLVGAVTRLLMERGQNHMTHCCEVLSKLRYSLIQRGYKVVGENFLDYRPDDIRYDCIVANPPFKGTEWLDHIEHMLELLKPGGTLLAIVPVGFTFREDKRIKAFRGLVEEHGWWQELPEDSFVESGTSVHTVMLSVRLPEEKQSEPVQPIEAVQSVSLW